MKPETRVLASIFALLLGSIPAQSGFAQDVPGCGSLKNAYGPFDYRDPALKRDRLPVVEDYHFTAEVQSLVAGKSGYVINDLDYTLRAFPNHAPALDSLARYSLRGGRIDTSIGSVECYFTRATTFASDDPVVRAVFANYLFKTKQVARAKEQYERALELAPDSADIAYNAGLFFLATGDREKARALAKIAYDQGYPLQGLKRNLERADQGQVAEPRPRP